MGRRSSPESQDARDLAVVRRSEELLREGAGHQRTEGELPAGPRFARSGTRGGVTLASAVGVRHAHTARFLEACGFLARVRAQARAPSYTPCPHVYVELAAGTGGRALEVGCAHCAHSDRIDLPRPARTMLAPAGVPPGLGEEVWRRCERFRDAHHACTGVGAGVGAEPPAHAERPGIPEDPP